jgi:hypothetical protein
MFGSLYSVHYKLIFGDTIRQQNGCQRLSWLGNQKEKGAPHSLPALIGRGLQGEEGGDGVGVKKKANGRLAA